MPVRRLQLTKVWKSTRHLWAHGALLVLLTVFSAIIAPEVVTAAEEFVPIDLTPPQIIIVFPQANATLTDTRPWIEVQIGDDTSGVAEDAFMISIDGIDVTKSANLASLDQGGLGSPTAWQLRYRPATPFWPGQHQVQIEATDGMGNIAMEYWQFSVEGKKPQVGFKVNLTNTLGYDPFPVGRLRNASTTALHFNLDKHRFTLQLRTTVANYPGTSTQPIFGGYYFNLNQYAFGWQNDLFTLQHGNVSIPLDAGLLHLGSVQQGTLFSRGNLNVFRGLSTSSTGLGLLSADIFGATYRWSSTNSKNYVYALQLGKSKTRVLGLLDERIFRNGILRTEVAYGMGKTQGDGLKIQGATTFLGIAWDADLTYLQEDYPLLHLAPLSSAEGGAYRMAINATKPLALGPRLNLGFVQTANNVDGSRERTRQSQSVQLGLTGQFAPDFTWQAGCQGARQVEESTVIQHFLRLGAQRKIPFGSWNSSVRISGEGAGDAVKYQWSATYNKSFTAIGLKTISSLQYSHETKGGGLRDGSWRMRLVGEKNWLEDRLKSTLALEFQNTVQRQFGAATIDRKSLAVEGGLDFNLGEDHNLTVRGKATFWQHGTTEQKRGIDYSLNLALSSRIF